MATHHASPRGEAGRVMLAFDESERRYVAIKLPAAFPIDGRPALGSRDLRVLQRQVRSILHERNAMERVHHPNVLQVERLVPGQKFGCNYAALVTEYASNGDMFDLVALGGALSESLAKLFFVQLLHALEACHANGVVHRDVKPENLLLDANFTLKLGDFGVAAVTPAFPGATVADVVARDESGTALYMAPEIRAKRLYRGTPVDVWSAGVTLFILLTGVPPFDFAQKGDVSYDYLLAGDMERFWATQPAESACLIGAEARDLVSAMLRVDPNQRMTVEQALQHPWLKDAESVDRDLVYKGMAARRQVALAAAGASS
ncbi:hypothetical protein BBJ28_00002329 [Nothophytophthora sp. Chile5]|nr:hypothetical protein BBJ28_00002329 [Nothophytophthora sp. Chile5]